MEKQFCSNCGKEVTGYRICTYCGTRTPQPNNTFVNKSIAKKNIQKSLIALAAVVFIIVVIVVAAATFGQKKAVITDVKGIVFDNFTTQTIGYTTSQTLSNAKWSAEKKADNYYWVTVSGYCPDLYSYIDATFKVYYYDDYVRANISHARINGEYCDDITSLLIVMGCLCNA